MSRELEDKSQTGITFAKDPSDKELLFNVYKELLELNNKGTNNLIKSSQKTLTDISPKRCTDCK